MRGPQVSTRTYSLFPYTTLFRYMAGGPKRVVQLLLVGGADFPAADRHLHARTGLFFHLRIGDAGARQHVQHTAALGRLALGCKRIILAVAAPHQDRTSVV